jgi:hypothetical protein
VVAVRPSSSPAAARTSAPVQDGAEGLVVELPQAGEDLQRPDQIQQREPWVEHERDRLLLLGCHRLPFRSGVRYCAAPVMGGGALVRLTAVG